MTTENTISVGQMLEDMQQGGTFSMRVVALDKERKRGGHIQEYHEAQLLTSKHVAQPSDASKASDGSKPRKAKHVTNYTRNIVLCVDGVATSEIRKIHPPLVIEYNGRIVTAKDAK